MSEECKHGMKSGCAYCHARTPAETTKPPAGKRRPRAPLSEKMNDRMTGLQRRLKAIRGES
jgi:hypothetical protein